MLSQIQKDIIIETMMPFKPVKIGVFGSYARNEETENSDIDILYEFKNTIGLFKLVRIQLELEKKLNRKIDLVSEKYIYKSIKPKILGDLKIIYGN